MVCVCACPGLPPSRSYLLGRALGGLGLWGEAVPELLRTVQLNSTCWRCHLAASEALVVVGKMEQALVEATVRGRER